MLVPENINTSTALPSQLLKHLLLLYAPLIPTQKPPSPPKSSSQPLPTLLMRKVFHKRNEDVCANAREKMPPAVQLQQEAERHADAPLDGR